MLVIVRQLEGEVSVITCETMNIECENERGVVVQIDVFDVLLVPDFCVNLFGLQEMRLVSD